MLKKIFFFLLFSTALNAQTEKIIKTSVQKATVFLSGAQLFSTETVYVPIGTSQIIFENVSPNLLESSVQVTSKNGNYLITDVRYNLKYSEEGLSENIDERKKKIEDSYTKIQDSITDFEFTLELDRKNIENLQTEKKLLLESKIARGETRDSLPLLMHSMDYVRERLKNIETEIIKAEKQKVIDTKFKTALNERRDILMKMMLNNYDSNKKKPTPQIIVTVFSNANTSGEFQINYFVSQAGWTTSYDLLASGDKNVIDFKQNALVYQNSGLDWKNVTLTLSTGNPNLSNEKPELNEQFVSYYMPTPQANADVGLNEVVVTGYYALRKQKSDNRSNFTVDFPDSIIVTKNFLRIEYALPIQYDVPSDNKSHSVVIQTKPLVAEYSFAVVPKIDPDVFLIARIADWEKLNLIAGKARLYFDGSYVGESNINPNNTTDTLQLNLGRDKSIAVTRLKIKEKSKERILSENRITSQLFEITIRNTKSVPIRLLVEDQMPVTKDIGITIDYTDTGGAKFSKDSGKLIWDLNLKSRETKKLTFSYDIKYPKEKTILGY